MTLDWSRAVVLTTTEFEVCWELVGLGETPWQLDPPRSGLTIAERHAIVAEVVGNLRRRGLGDHGGPGSVLADQLRLLACPDHAFDIRFRSDVLVAGVAAVRDSYCALAVRHGSEIAMLSVRPDAAAASLLDLVGSIPAGRGREVRLPAEVLDEARVAGPRDHDRFVDELEWRGLARADAWSLVDMCRGVRLRGQLGASASARDGTRVRRAPHVVGFHATASGTFRQTRRRSPGGDTVTIGPTSRARMLADFVELVEAAT